MAINIGGLLYLLYFVLLGWAVRMAVREKRFLLLIIAAIPLLYAAVVATFMQIAAIYN